MTKEDFLKELANWTNYKVLLWSALEATKGDVIEMGMGSGSTPFLNQYCKDAGRKLFSYDNNFDWSEKFKPFQSDIHKIICVDDWDTVSASHANVSVILIDHSPGERRKTDIARFAERAEIVIVHDSEPSGWNASDYQVRPEFRRFKFVKDRGSESPTGAWSSALSNYIDVTTFEI